MTLRFTGGILLVAVLVAGCGGDDPSAKPTFGGGSEPAGASTSELADLKAEAKIEDCPRADERSTEAGPAVEDGLPDVELDCLGGGRPVNLSELSGPMVINLWASWCKPCREELPMFARADREYGDRVDFLGIDVADAAPEAALRLADSTGATFPHLADPDSEARGGLRVTGLPQTIFVDARGRMIHTERAPFRSYADVTAAIRRHLGVTP
jgi:thiol-disulfide isomerase/thioredoxin